MPDASYLQTSFLGGEWSPYAQGRMDDQRYRTGMNVCLNTIPVEEGSATRRPGTRLAAATRSGAFGVLRNFAFEQQQPYSLELTAGHMRFFSGPALVSYSASERLVTAVSSATPAVVTVTPDHDLADNDQVYFRMEDPSAANASLNILLGREFIVSVVTTATFSIRDAVTGELIDGTGVTVGGSALLMEKITDLVTPYAAADLQEIVTVQDQEHLLLLHNDHQPQLLESTTPQIGDAFAIFSFGAADLLDGPYLDPVEDAAVITASGTTGSITLTISGGTTRWNLTDVGRLVRLFYAPAAWASATAYTAGQKVEYNGGYYVALRATTGDTPDISTQDWGVDVAAALWTWAKITAYTSTTVVTATIMGEDLPAVTPTISVWRLGLFSETTGWPSAGVYHENRLWLTGVQGNRIDGSKTGDLLNFEPTSPDGTVADDNACSYVFAATDVNKIFWMVTDNKGIVCGTQAGEWVVQASQQNDPLTPTSVQAHRYTDYGCADVQARRAGLAIAFVQRHQKKVQEYITTDSRGFAARNISVTGKHLTSKTQIAELAYQRETTPIIWARTTECDTDYGGELIGCTYKRESPFASEPADFSGWHRHELGNDYKVVSIQTGPSFNGDLDALSLVVRDPNTGYHYVYVLTDIFETNNQLGDAYFVDHGTGPAMFDYQTNSLTLYGLWRLEGASVAAFVGGIDMGDFTVTNGTITVPVNGASSLLTTSWINSLSTCDNFRGFGLRTPTPEVAPLPDFLGIMNIEPIIDEAGLAGDTEGDFSCIDWDARRMYLMDITSGLMSVNIDNWTQITSLVWPSSDPPNRGPLVMDLDGKIIGCESATNAAIIYRIDPDTLAEMYHFGVASASFDTTATRAAAMLDRVPIQAGSRNFLVNSATIINEIATFDLDYAADGITPGISWTGFSAATANGDAARVVRGKPIGNLGIAYVIDRRNGANGSSNQSATPINIYRVVVSQDGTTSMTLVGTLDMDDLFGTGNWRHYDDVGDVIADETPGHEGFLMNMEYSDATAWNAGSTYQIIGEVVSFGGHDWANLQNPNLNHQPDVSPTFWTDMGVSHAALNAGGDEQKLIKVEMVSGSPVVIWRERIFGFSVTQAGGQAASTRIRHGRYCVIGTISTAGIGGPKRVWGFNTITGANTTFDVEPLTAIGSQWYNDATGEMVFQCDFGGHDATPPVGQQSPVATGRAASWSADNLSMFTKATAPYLPAIDFDPAETFLSIPVAIGFTYTSQGQILRPIVPQESGAANGPALAKTRRSHMFGGLLHKTQGISFGTVFSNLRPAEFRTPGGTPYPLTTLWSGIYWNTLEDDYSFDSMLCWEISRPYPATVLTLGPFVNTQDR